MSKRFLIVDDASFMRMMLRDILTQGGYEVVGEAADGEEAIEAYRKFKPDLVTMDIVMPKKDGLEALKEVIALDPGAAVIMVSAMGQDMLIQEAMDVGASGFIVKPFRPQIVLDAVKHILDEVAAKRK